MGSSVTLQHEDVNSGTPVSVKCTTVLVTGKKLTQKKPNSNGVGPVEVHTQGYENLQYLLRGVQLVEGTNKLSYDDIVALYKASYDGTNPVTLTVVRGSYNEDTGVTTEVTLPDMDGGTSGIRCVLDADLSIPFDAAQSRDAYRPTFDLRFVETD